MTRKVMRLLMLLAALSAVGAWARGHAQPTAVDKDHQAVLDAAADYLYSPSGELASVLERMGYVPPQAVAEEWRRVPDLQKLMYAYHAAREAGGDEGAGRFLALLSADLSRREPASREDGVLRKSAEAGAADKGIVSFLDGLYGPRRPNDPPPEPPVAFRNPQLPPDRRPPALPESVMRTLLAVEQFSAAGVLASSQSDILIRNFGASEDRAIQLLAESPTFTLAMSRALADRNPAARPQILRDLVTDMYEQFPQVETHAALAPWIDRDRPAGAGRPPRRPRDGPSARQAPERAPTPPKPPSGISARQRYDEAIQELNKSKGGTRFEEMGTKVRKFGGVVFGSPVTGNLPNPRAMAFQAAGVGGKLVFDFPDGQTLEYPGVLAEDARIAAKMILQGNWTEGQGLGLVGLISDGIHFDINGGRLRLLERRKVILHPDLIDTELGHAMINVDTVPRNQFNPWLAPLAKKNPKANEDVANLLRQRQMLVSTLGYVFTDVPMRLSSDKGQLVVAAGGEGFKGLPPAFARRSFLELRLETDPGAQESADRVDRKFARAFSRVVPTLASVSYDLDRVNRFAAVLSLFRWARLGGVDACRDLPAAGKNAAMPTPDAIATPFVRVPDGDIEGELKDLPRLTQERSERIRKTVDDNAEYRKRLRQTDFDDAQAPGPIVPIVSLPGDERFRVLAAETAKGLQRIQVSKSFRDITEALNRGGVRVASIRAFGTIDGLSFPAAVKKAIARETAGKEADAPRLEYQRTLEVLAGDSLSDLGRIVRDRCGGAPKPLQEEVFGWLALNYLAAFLTAAEPPPVAAQGLKVVGKLARDDDPYFLLDIARPCKTQVVRLKAGVTYVIDLDSADFDTVLDVEDASGKSVAFNDDRAPGNLNSTVVYTPMRDGLFVVYMTCLDGKPGQFTLSVREK
jgi:hypothetical protein